MRRYSVAVAALAIQVPPKWLDNAISQNTLPDIAPVRRGVARRITHSALLQLALTRELHVGLGLSVRDAIGLAHDLLAHDGDADTWRGPVHIICDRPALERTLNERLRAALESAPTPRRGRPPERAGRK